MEASVVKTKNAVNRNAEDVQRDCDKLNNTNLRGEVRAQRIADRIASGVAENIGVVSANTVELSGESERPAEYARQPTARCPKPRRRESPTRPVDSSGNAIQLSIIRLRRNRPRPCLVCLADK